MCCAGAEFLNFTVSPLCDGANLEMCTRVLKNPISTPFHIILGIFGDFLAGASLTEENYVCQGFHSHPS